MKKQCEHWQIEAYMVQETGDAAGMWACVNCKRKFVPLDLEQEKDAARYRKLMAARPWPIEVSDPFFANPFEKNVFDAAVDAWDGK